MTVEVRPDTLAQIAEVHALAERLRELAKALRVDGIDVRLSVRPDFMNTANSDQDYDARVMISMDTQMRSIPR